MAELKNTITLPETLARLKIGVAIFGALYDGTKELGNEDLMSVPLVQIGAVRKVDYTNDRGDIKYYRTFGLEKNGEIDETYPSLADYKLKFDTVVLYKKDFFTQFGYDSSDIMYQSKPAIIQLVMKAPGDIPKKTLTFAGVWFQNNPINFDAEADDLLITKEINAAASRVIPSNPKI